MSVNEPTPTRHGLPTMTEDELIAAHGLALSNEYAGDRAEYDGRRPLRFERPLGASFRSRCWRPECVQRNADYLTVQEWDNGLVVAWCHLAVYSNRDSLDYRADRFAHDGKG